jgi:hypothetical protein
MLKIQQKNLYIVQMPFDRKKDKSESVSHTTALYSNEINKPNLPA